nr:MAG TPA: HIGH-POTENTIAL IRON-SULFUR PROTEIN sulfur cluster, electron transport [Caudoviricetes sp.]
MEIPYIILLAFVLLAIVIALMMMKDDGRHCKNCKYFDRSGKNGGTCLFHFKYFYEWETCHRWRELKNEDTNGD